MTEAVADSCANCIFNSVNRGEEKFVPADVTGLLCEVRSTRIHYPYFCFCNNHHTRNVMRRRTPRGLAWTSAIPRSLYSKPTKRFPWSLSPPSLHGQAYQIPFFDNMEPLPNGPAVCWLCQKQNPISLIVRLRDDGERTFCGTGHYLDWWMVFAPEAQALMDRDPLDEETVRDRLKPLGPKLFRAGVLAGAGSYDSVLDMFGELDDVFVELNYMRLDAAQARSLLAAYRGDISVLGSYSPHLLRLCVA